MAIDIRQARPGAGTVPPFNVASEKTEKPLPDVDDATGSITVDYGGDAVIATYMDFLKNNGITEDDVQQVLDALLTSGNVVYNFQLFDRIPVSFVSREVWVDDYIVELLDDMASKTAHISNVRYNNTVAECNLAASMTAYNNERYTIATREDLDKARERIRKMPYVIQNALVKKLAVFDRTLAVATSDWAVKNFMKPRQESSEPGQS